MNQDLKAIYDTLFAAIADTDEKLDSLNDSESAGKRKITNDLVTKYQEDWTPVTEGLVSQMTEMDDDMIVGIYTGLLRELKKSFDERVQNHVVSLAENAPKIEPLISEDEAKELSAARSEAYQQIKQVVELAKTFSGEDWDMPPVRRGSRGKRGKRALSYYNWFVNGEAVAADSNTPAGVSKVLGFDKAAEFTKYLKGLEIDTRKPPAEFEFTYGDKSVKAVRSEDAPEVPEEDTEDDDEDDEEETEDE